jgi:hypothetical protein
MVVMVEIRNVENKIIQESCQKRLLFCERNPYRLKMENVCVWCSFGSIICEEANCLADKDMIVYKRIAGR